MADNTNDIETTINQGARRVAQTDAEIIDIINQAVGRGLILISQNGQTSASSGSVQNAGGTNFCPNSDFSYSLKASTEDAVDPTDASAENRELFKVSKEGIDTDVGSLVSDTEVDDWIPLWNRDNGVIEMGAADISQNLGISIQMDANLLQPKTKWYLRAALATADDTPLPDGTIFFMGFWIKNLDGSEGWVEGEQITLTAKRVGLAGSTSTDYLLVAKIGTGYSIASAVVTIADAPDILDSDNKILLEFVGTAGFTHLQLYRKRAGVTYLIADVTNDVQIHHYDEGDNIGAALSDFPSIANTTLRAYSEVFPFVVPITRFKTFSEFTVLIPNFDTTQVAAQGTYIRFGLLTATAFNKQLFVDTIWAGTSFNVWSPSPNDNPHHNQVSVEVVTGAPNTGTSTDPPPVNGGGNTCVIDTTDLLLEGDKSIKFKDVTENIIVESGQDRTVNRVSRIIRGRCSQIIEVVFDRGLSIRCTDTHRFLRSFLDGTGIQAFDVKVGDVFQGRDAKKHENVKLTVVEKNIIFAGKSDIVALKIAKKGNWTPHYAGGDAENGIFCFFHNRKLEDGIDMPDV